MSDHELDASDQEIAHSHSKLLDAIAQLNKGQRVKRPERSEPTLEVSEFHLVKSSITDKDAVHVQDLAKSLGNKGYQIDLTKKLATARRKAKLLAKPLEKPAAERIKRIVGFEGSRKELKKWNAVITANRTSSSIKFPLQQSSLQMEPKKEFVSRFRLQSELEKNLQALEPPKKEMDSVKNKDGYTLTLQEAIARRQEIAKIRAQHSYKEAKAQRQKKIKSKKFHRVQRKERMKQQIKEFEILQKTDPDAALEKLEQLDKTRAEERMSLRHKSTGKWATNKQIRAKYDKDTRQELAQQLAISRDLTQKIKLNKSSDEEENENEGTEEINTQPSTTDKGNPWVQNIKTESEIDEFIKSYRNYWDEKTNKSESINTEKLSDNSQNDCLATRSAANENAESYCQLNGLDMCIEDKEKYIDDHAIIEGKQEEQKRRYRLPNKLNKKPEIKKNVLKESSKLSEKPDQEKVVNDTKCDTTKTKSQRKEKNMTKNLTFTSSWNVESLYIDENEELNVNTKDWEASESITKLFDGLESELETKSKRLLQNAKRTLETSENKENILRKKQKSQKYSDCFDGLTMKETDMRPRLNQPLDESTGHESSEQQKVQNLIDSITTKESMNKKEQEIDPTKYLNVKPKHLYTKLPDVTGDEEALDNSEDEEQKHKIISEAFADDDVVEEFRKEKEEEVRKGQPKPVDLSLPGWGSWGGTGVKPSKRKRRRFIIELPKEMPRRDENKGNVVIFEDEDKKTREHRVNDLPHPFTTVKDYEASLRMPIGRNFVPEISHTKLTEPRVQTKIGQIIEPMDEDVLLNVKKSSLSKRKAKGRDNKKKQQKQTIPRKRNATANDA